MNWQVVTRPEAEKDVIEIAAWYDSRSRQHPRKNIRWRYPKSFPYRVVYEVFEREKTVVVAAVLHAARHDREWKRRI